MINDFLFWLKENDKAENTIYNYKLAVNDYFEWFKRTFKKLPMALYVQNIRAYLQYLSDNKSLSAITINTKMYALQAFNNFLISKGLQQDVVISKSSRIKVQNGYTSPALFEKIHVNSFIQTVLEGNNKRDHSLVSLLAYTGIRVSEALNIHLTLDLFLEARELVIRKGKSNKQRTLLLNDKVKDAINSYLEVRMKHKYKESPYLFISNKGFQLSRITVYNMFAKYSRIANIENILSPHDLRHYFCSNALESGFGVHEVAYIAGHSNIHTTLLYTNPSRKKMLEKLNQL